MVWIIGCNGMLGTQLCRTLEEKNLSYAGTDSAVSILDYAALEGFASGKDISCIVNCAAYTAVDKAESDADFARALNCDGVRNIARLAKKFSVPLIHISTDYVFDGKGDFDERSLSLSKCNSPIPYSEDSAICPIGVYGKTKAAGEKALQKETEDFYILRTAWLYGFYGKNFVYTMIRAMNARESVKVVSDQRGTPTNCETLSNVIVKIIDSRLNSNKILKQNDRNNKGDRVQNDNCSSQNVISTTLNHQPPNGIYHVTDEGEATWFEFTKEIFAQGCEAGIITNKNCAINSCTTADYPTSAKRPAYSVLSKAKIQKTLGITLPEWQESLKKFMNSLSANTKYQHFLK